MEIDFTSMYKAMMGMDEIPIPLVGNFKMVIIYKRV